MSQLFKSRVTGTEDNPNGTLLRPFDDEYEITAESAPAALLQLIHRDLWWDTLDIERPFTIEIVSIEELPKATEDAQPEAEATNQEHWNVVYPTD